MSHRTQTHPQTHKSITTHTHADPNSTLLHTDGNDYPLLSVNETWIKDTHTHTHILTPEKVYVEALKETKRCIKQLHSNRKCSNMTSLLTKKEVVTGQRHLVLGTMTLNEWFSTFGNFVSQFVINMFPSASCSSTT